MKQFQVINKLKELDSEIEILLTGLPPTRTPPRRKVLATPRGASMEATPDIASKKSTDMVSVTRKDARSGKTARCESFVGS